MSTMLLIRIVRAGTVIRIVRWTVWGKGRTVWTAVAIVTIRATPVTVIPIAIVTMVAMVACPTPITIMTSCIIVVMGTIMAVVVAMVVRVARVFLLLLTTCREREYRHDRILNVKR